MTLSTAERRLVVMDAMALRGDVVVGENFLACGVSNKKQLAMLLQAATPLPCQYASGTTLRWVLPRFVQAVRQ